MALTRTQQACLLSKAVYRGFVGGRGAGKSYTGAYDLLRRAKPGRLYLAANPTYPNLRDTTMRTFRKLASQIGRLVRIKEGSEPSAKFRTACGKGEAEVIFRSTKEPETLRGPNLSGAWLDEASLMKRAAFDVVIACLREGGGDGWLLATYTPKGRGSWTYKQFQTEQPDTEFFHSKTSDNPWLSEGFEARLRRQYSARLQAQEIDAATLDDGDAAVPFDDIVGCQMDDVLWPNRVIPTPEHHALRVRHELYLGYDVGRTRDRAVQWLWERVGDVLYCRSMDVMHETSFAEQEERAAYWLKAGFVVKCFIDHGGIGMDVAERLAKRFPSIVEGIALSSQKQGQLAELMRRAFERREVRIPDDEDLRNDFQLVSAPVVQNGRSVVKTDREEEIGHADRFWAAALALDAATHAPRPRPTFAPRLVGAAARMQQRRSGMPPRPGERFR